MKNQRISAITMKELDIGNMQIRCHKEYKTSVHVQLGQKMKRITKHVHYMKKPNYQQNIVTDKSLINFIIPTLCLWRKEQFAPLSFKEKNCTYKL
jgi:hypothetical protein